MRRPLFCTGFCYLGGIAVVLYPGAPAAAWLLGFCVLGALLAALHGRERVVRSAAICLLCAALGVGSCVLYGERLQRRFAPLDDVEGQFSGVVLEGGEELTPGRCEVYGVLETADARYERVRLQVRIYNESPLEMGDSFTAPVKLRTLDLQDGYSRSLAAEGIYLRGYLTVPAQLLEEDFYPLRAGIAGLRLQIYTALRALLPGENGGFVAAVTIGLRAGLSSELLEAARRAGVYHILAISGMHLAIFAQVAAILLRGVTRRGGVRAAAALLLVWFAAALGGFGYAVLRAAVMATVVQFGVLLRRRSDTLNALGLAVWLLLLQNPLAAGSLSFVLSVAATLGICLLASPLYRAALRRLRLPAEGRLGKPGRGALSILAASVAAQLFTLPILALVYRSFTLTGLLSSLLIQPLMTAVLALGYLLCGAVLLPLPWLADLLAALLAPCVGMTRWLIAGFARLPLVLYLNHSWQFALLFGALAILLWLWRVGASAALWRTAARLGVLLLLLGMVSTRLLVGNVLRVVALEDTVLLLAGERAAVIGDTRDLTPLVAEFDRYGIEELDLLLFTGDAFTTGASAAELLRSMPVHNLAAPDTAIAEAYLQDFTAVRRLPQGRLEATLFGGVRLRYAAGETLWIETAGGAAAIPPRRGADSPGDVVWLGEEVSLPAGRDGLTVLEYTPERCELLLRLE